MEEFKDDHIKKDNYNIISSEYCGILTKPIFGPVGKGYIKQRYSDFCVIEIDLDGNLVVLDEIHDNDDISSNYQPETISPETLKNLDDFNLSSQEMITIDCPVNKSERKKIHFYIRNQYENIISYTTQNPLKITVKKASKKIKSTDMCQSSKIFPFITFSLYKENISTSDAVNFIAKRLHLSSQNFSFCGNKDKRAITLQRVSVSKISIEKIKKFQLENKITFNKNRSLIIGNIRPSKNPLKLGDLTGNFFQIIIRNFTPFDSKSDIDYMTKELIEKMKINGFPNFFGKQRFGIGNTSTHIVGSLILKNDWLGVIDAILCDRPNIDSSIKEAIKIWKNHRDSLKALEILNKKSKYSFEAKIFKKIQMNDNIINEKILTCVPGLTQSLYLHSFQSYVWNRVISERINVMKLIIKKYSLNILVGDLVLLTDSNVYLITDEDVKLKKYSISDIVHPLPDYYIKCLDEFNINHSHFSHKIKNYSLKGSYRNIFVRPLDLTYSFVDYFNDQPLISSIVPHIHNNVICFYNLCSVNSNNENSEVDCDLKTKLALKLSFKLPPSAYATSLLREFIDEIEPSKIISNEDIS